MLEHIKEYAQGNPGALNFLLEVIEHSDPMIGLAIFLKLQEYPTLRGTNLYVLYSDLAGKDLNSVVELLNQVPQVVLENACAQQDYSGRKMVAPYLNLEN